LLGARKKAAGSYRRRMKRKGLVRVEVQVLRADAPLLRNVAGALADPNRAAETRALLRDRFATRGAKRLKGLLADAPLDDIDLERTPDMGREALGSG
jgi:hypothetical protein